MKLLLPLVCYWSAPVLAPIVGVLYEVYPPMLLLLRYCDEGSGIGRVSGEYSLSRAWSAAMFGASLILLDA